MKDFDVRYIYEQGGGDTMGNKKSLKDDSLF